MYVGHLSSGSDVVVGGRVATAATGVSRYTGGRGLVKQLLDSWDVFGIKKILPFGQEPLNCEHEKIALNGNYGHQRIPKLV